MSVSRHTYLQSSAYFPRGSDIPRDAIQPHGLVAFITASRHRSAVVGALRDGPKTPTQISRVTGLHRSNVSRALSQLCSSRIAYCVTPDLRKGKMFGLSPEQAIQVSLWQSPGELPAREPEATGEPLPSFTPQVRGEAMLSGIAAAGDTVGDEGLARLSKACGFSFLGIQREGWYSMDLHHQFLNQLERLFDPDDTGVLYDMGRRSIGYLPYLQEFLRRKLDLIAQAERIPLVHGHYFNFGRFEVVPKGDGFEARQYDMLPTLQFCRARRGNYQGVMETIGLDTEITELRCAARGAPHCAFRVLVKGLRKTD